jgi:DNA segregation ATPase FtsK/SpoIIIE-like protein
LDEATKLSMLAQIMGKAWTGERPEGIEILRSIIPLRSILPPLGQGPERLQTILGLEDLDLQPALFDLKQRGPHFVVAGPPLSGKTTALRAWALALAHCYPPDRVAMVLIDFQQRLFKYGGQHTLGDLPHVLETVSEKEELTAVIEKLQYEYLERPGDLPRPAIFVLADSYDEFGNVVGSPTRSPEFSDMAELARKFGTEELHFVIGGSLSITRSMDDLMKQVVSSRYGLGLESPDSAQALGGRVRSSAAMAEFPPGRGYVVKSGRTSMIQVAIPHDESNIEGSLDQWVAEIAAHYPERARWYIEINPPPEPEDEAEEDTASVPAK